MTGIVDESTYVESGNSIGATMTSSSSANTQGAWDEAIASTSEETYWVHFSARINSVTDEPYLINIGVGAAASEVVKVANIPYFNNLGFGQLNIAFPLTIANGARVAVQCQCTGSSQPLNYTLKLSNDSSYGTSTSNETIGADTSLSKGSVVDPGVTANTVGADTQLSSSTGIAYNYFLLFMGNNDNNGQVMQDIIINWREDNVNVMKFAHFSNGAETNSHAAAVWHTVPVSTEVDVNAQSTYSTDTDRLMDIVCIGFAVTAPAGGGSPSGARNPLRGPIG